MIKKFFNRVTELVAFYMENVDSRDTTSLAYYTILSIIPTITIIIVIIQTLNIDIIDIAAWVESVFNSNIASTINAFVQNRSLTAHSIITLIISVYVISKGMYNMGKTVQRMYGGPKNIVIIEGLNSVVNTLAMIFIILLMFVMLTVVPAFFNMLELGFLAEIVKYLGSFLLIFIVLLTMNKVIPPIKLSLKEVYRGAIISSTLFLLIIIIFSIYLGFVNYSNVYGPFASIAVLFIVFNFIAKAIYVGFAFNAMENSRNL